MNKENPHELSNDRVAAILEDVPCGAKEEDLIRAGYHSRDEVVDALVGASESARALLMIQAANQPELLDSDGFRWLKSSLEQAIAKAKP